MGMLEVFIRILQRSGFEIEAQRFSRLFPHILQLFLLPRLKPACLPRRQFDRAAPRRFELRGCERDEQARFGRSGHILAFSPPRRSAA